VVGVQFASCYGGYDPVRPGLVVTKGNILDVDVFADASSDHWVKAKSSYNSSVGRRGREIDLIRPESSVRNDGKLHFLHRIEARSR
jgi:hypothetical protein